MAVRKISSGNLIGGISTLSGPHRKDNQTRGQTNAEPSLLHGLRKRPGGKYKGKMSSVTTLDHTFHSINTDGEEYMVAASNAGIAIHDVKNNQAIPVRVLTRDAAGVIISGADVDPATNAPYLSTAVLNGDLRLLTIRDTTFVLNKNETVGTVTSGGTAPACHNSGYVFVKTLVGGGSSGVDSYPKYTISVKRRDDLSGVLVGHSITGQSHLYGRGTGVTGSLANPLPFDELAYIRTQAEVISYQAGELRRALTGEYVAAPDALGLNYTTLFESNTPAAYRRFAAGDQMFVFSTGAQSVIGFFEHMTIDGAVVEFHPIVTADSIESVSVDFQKGSSTVSGFGRFAESISDLPLECDGLKVVKITGGDESDYDDYYVQFRLTGSPTSTGYGEGGWVECSELPWDQKSLDPATMPHILIRRLDVSGLATGTGNQIYFEWAPADIPPDINDGDGWDARAIGDETTNPTPSFVGQKLADIFFYNNRLGFLTGDQTVSLSSVGRYFNFWRTSVLNLLDSDPILTNVGDTATSTLRYAVPFSRELIIFGDRSQYSMSSSGVFGPRSVSIDKVSEYNVGSKARPALLETTALFASGATTGEQVWQLFRADETSYSATEATEAIPGLLGSEVVHLTASSVAGMIAAATTDGKLFIQNYFRSGAQLIQQAWWELVLADTAGVAHVDFIGNTLRVAVLKTGVQSSTPEMVIVDIDFDSNSTVNLDHEVSRTGSDPVTGGVWDSNTDLTKYTLPYTSISVLGVRVFEEISPNNLVPVSHVSATAGSVNISVFLQGQTNGSQPGTSTLRKFIFGMVYPVKVKLFPPQLHVPTTAGGTTPLVGSRVTVNKMAIAHQASGTFDVTIDSAFRPAKTYRSSALTVGTSSLESAAGTTGVFTVPIHQPIDDLDISITDTTPGRLALENIEWELQHRSRASTWAGR